MHLIAHRGLYNENIGENTMDAYINALNNNYDGIELDVRLTKDNEVVCIHDKLINRTSDGKGNINNLMYKEVFKYNFGTKKNKAKIPLLKDVIKKIDNTIIFIELKERIEPKILEEILSLNNSNEYYICSFSKEHIDYIKDINIKCKKGIINYIINSIVDISNYDFVLILESLFKENIYEYLYKVGVEPVIYGTFNKINIKNKKLISNLKYIL